MTLDDSPARARIAGDLRASFVVEASAGSGKTTALVGRIVAVLRAGVTTLPRIFALTFTDKAAGEMKLRLRAELDAARAAAGDDGERDRLTAALADLEAARVGTIHGVCADLLRELPVEARVDPAFEIAAGDEAERLRDEAFDLWFQAQLADPPEGVRRLLRRRPRGRDAKTPRELLRDAAGRRAEHRDFAGAWRRDPFDRARVLGQIVDRLRALAARARPGYDPLAKNLQAVARFVATVSDLDGLEADLHELMRDGKAWTAAGTRGFWGPAHEEVRGERDAAATAIRAALIAADADLAACLWHELASYVALYETLLAAAGRLDFLDLLVRTRDLLRDDAAVRRVLARRVTHVFVDEVQDIDPLQAEIILFLTADDPEERDAARVRPRPGSLFVVGDPKQSIYRFRRADLGLYQATAAQLRAAGAETLTLHTSHRATVTLASAVNAAFQTALVASPGQAGYASLVAGRPDPEGQPSLIALPVPRPYGYSGRVWRDHVEGSYADAVGAFIEELTASGWKTGGGEKLAPRHVCLLLRRFVAGPLDATRVYTRALEARGIPHVLVGGRSFHAREEVAAVRVLLAAVEWPDDNLAVYAALRGPFFALSDEELLLGAPLHPLREAGTGRVGDALRLLKRAHLRRNRRGVADTLAELLEATRAHAGLALRQGGEQALANVLRVLDQARRFEAGGATSFRAFVERLEVEAEEGETGEAPVVEEGTEGVRIMTVHRAKGLEFPVVILGDPMAGRTTQRPSRHVDLARRLWVEPLAGCAPIELLENAVEAHRRDDEEALRLAYVAATRARDLLVVPAFGAEPAPLKEGTWLDVLAPVLAPRAPREPAVAPGCPPLGQHTVAELPPGVLKMQVMPGAHVPQAGEHAVVWWGTEALRLGAGTAVGVTREQLLAEGPGSEPGRRAYATWKERRAALAVTAERPTMPAVAAARAGGEGAHAIEVLEVPRAGGPRPAGRRFGILVHAVLAAVPFDGAGLAALVTALARSLGATEPERAAAERVVAGALRHAVVARAGRADEVRRECPVHLVLPGGTVAEGVVDLAFREGDRWTVVDWKTDAELAERLDEYRAQISLYVEAVRAATGQDADGVLVVV